MRRLLVSLSVLACFLAPLSARQRVSVTDVIKVDQVGYLPWETKLAMLTATPAGWVDVRRLSDGFLVLKVAAGGGGKDAASGDTVRQVDFSPLTATGRYYLDAPGLGRSLPFDIGRDVYRSVWRAAMRGFYAQRCGTAVDMAPDFPGYRHAACHLDDARFDPSSGKSGRKTAVGGWHDAGDYGKYVINAAIAVGEVLWTYQDYKAAVGESVLNLPETGDGCPDILNEAKWELDWMLAMQDGDGGVWEKLSSERFGGFVLPQNDHDPRYIIGGREAAPWKDGASTAGFAAVMAMAARLYRPFKPTYAAACLEASLKAYAWVRANPGSVCGNPPNVKTGNYCGADQNAELLWAAAELLLATGQPRFEADFEATKGAPPYVSGVQDWKNVRNLAMWAYADSALAPSATATVIRRDTVSDASGLLTTCAANEYRNTLAAGDYRWGSNGEVGDMNLVLLMANRYQASGAFVQAVSDNLHYLFGRNCFGVCWVTQVGGNAVLHPHHRPSGSPEYAHLPPWPGLLVGGPNASGGDPIMNTIALAVPPMRHWRDQTMAYSCNEVAVNWQAPLVYSLAALLPVPEAASSGSLGR